LGSSASGISANISGLLANTTYYFQLQATSSAGAASGSINSFKTNSAGQAPTPVTGSATAVTTNSATLGGTVNPNGLDTHFWFLYGASSSLSGASQTPSQDLGSGSSASGISANISGLSANTTYYFQLQASSSAGVASGAINSFKTNAAEQAPTASTGSASAVTVNSATLGGTVNPNGLDTHFWFLYGTSSSLSGASQTPSQDLGSGSSASGISANISGLSANTTYYFQLQTSSSAGVASGAINSFKTNAAKPPTPTGLSPGSVSAPGTTVTTLIPTVGWNASPGATQYSVAVVQISTGATVVAQTVSTTSLTCPSLENGVTYISQDYRVLTKLTTAPPFTTIHYFLSVFIFS
jgi:uncharacterized membrane protein